MQTRIHYLFITLVSALLIAGCSQQQALVKQKQLPEYNKEALDLVIDGALANITGRPKEALLKFHQAAEFEQSPGIYLAIAEDYYYLNEINTSIKIINKLLSLDPNNLDGLILLAACYEHNEDYQKAMTVYEQIVKIEPNNVENLYYLTSLQIALQQYKDAYSSFQRLVDLGMTDSEFRMKIGYLFLQNHAYKQASKVYLDVLKDEPDNEELYLALAAIQNLQQDSTGAVKWYKQGLAVNPRFNDLRAELRDYYENHKLWDDAIATFSGLVSQDTTNLDNKLLLGHFYLEKGDTLKTIEMMNQALISHPNRERTYLVLASLYKIMGDTLQAIDIYEKGLAKNESFFYVRQGLKNVYLDLGQWQNAIDLFQPLTQNDTTTVSARIEIASILMDQGDTTHAIQECESLLPAHADDWRVHATLGQYYFFIRDHQKARTQLDQVINMRDDLPHLWILRGINFIQMDSLDQAENNFLVALEMFPDQPNLNYYAASLYSQLQRFDKALPLYLKAVEKDPENIQYLLALAGTYDETGDYEQSTDLYERLIQMAPQSPIVNNNYAYHLSLRGANLNEALNYSKLALAADPNNGPYLDTMGWIYYQLKDYDKAREYIEKSLQVEKDSPEVMEHLGDVYQKLGDHEKATFYWQKSLELDGNRTHLNEKLGRSVYDE